MRLWPRSLVGRTALLVAGIVILGQIVSALLLYWIYLDARLERTAAMIATEVEAIGRALDAMAPAQRERYVEALKSGLDIRIIPSATTPGVPAPDRYVVQRFERLVRARFAQPVAIRWQKSHVWLAWPPARAGHWIGLPYAPLESDPWRVTGVWLALGGVFGLLGALWIARRINRPLGALAGAALRLGRGETPHALPETGPTEIAALSQAFNRMAHDVQRLTAERTLLLAGVSHDLRTPLSRLRLALEMLGGDADVTLKQGMVQDVDDMDRIIEQFLVYARSGEMEPARPADLNQLVRETVTRYRRQEKTIALDLQPLPRAALRVVAVQRLLANLIDNGLRHGGGAVEVRTRAGDGRVFLSVLDRGPGLVTDADGPTPFHRMRLGLVVVERIAQLHGGRVQFRPRAGGGLEVCVELPLTPAADRANASGG